MNWEWELINVYLYICQQYKNHMLNECQRMSNNSEPEFSDEEVISVYLFGIIEKQWTIKDIYDYTRKHLWAWFPKLPSYVAYVNRLNQLCEAFPLLIERLQADFPKYLNIEVQLMDSMPIMMANEARSSCAKVARELADKGYCYCASKKVYYYGVKLHVIAFDRYQTIPFPNFMQLSCASANDLTIFRCLEPNITNCQLFGDKAYADSEFQLDLLHSNQVSLWTPIKKEKGQAFLSPENQLLSSAVSRVRQPIESFFGWLQEHTHIQLASKVRSRRGLLVHVFGRIAAALMLLVLNFNS
jgi:hypothetical protein